MLDSDADIPKEKQLVELVLFRDLMGELKSFIDFHSLIHRDGHNQQDEEAVALSKQFPFRGSRFDDREDSKEVVNILKRFKMINPSLLLTTIKKCE